MKKNLSSLVVAALIMSTSMLPGCGGKDDPTPENCDKSSSAFEDALNAYIADPVKSKCEAVKSAASNLLDCPGLTAAEKTNYQNQVNDIVCD